MWCPRCKSSRVQRGFHSSQIVLQVAGLHGLLCNNCGLEFKGFDPLRRLPRSPVKRKTFEANQRRFPRYKVHLPATISLVERNVLTWDVGYTHRCRGHCETISQVGMALSFLGSRIPTDQLTRPGCALYVTLSLPAAEINTVVRVVYWDKRRNGGGWSLGTTISQMGEVDAARLAAYIKKRSELEPLVTLD